ncbi:hypothetical protein GCM10025857_02090 [Alicyclobacillus contaminans]|nr:hypothetical protein GCM10025857_02090 [Alicyclobacillus contaminans]
MIADLSPSDFEVDATVDQTDAANIKAGQTAEISLSTSGSPSLTGQVENISYLPETQSGVTVYPVTIRVDNPNNSSIHLLPGQTVSVSVVEQQAKQVLMVPAAALTQRRGTVGVYVKAGQGTTSNNDTTSSSEAETGSRVPVGLQFQPVTVGLYGGNEVEIKSGLTEGEQVAVVTQTATTTTGATRSGNTGLGGMLGGAGGIGFGGQGGAGGRGVLGGGYAGRGGYGGVGGAGGGYNGARSGGGN